MKNLKDMTDFKNNLRALKVKMMISAGTRPDEGYAEEKRLYGIDLMASVKQIMKRYLQNGPQTLLNSAFETPGREVIQLKWIKEDNMPRMQASLRSVWGTNGETLYELLIKNRSNSFEVVVPLYYMDSEKPVGMYVADLEDRIIEVIGSSHIEVREGYWRDRAKHAEELVQDLNAYIDALNAAE